MKRKTAFLLSACLLFAQTAFAQNEFPCATDYLHQQALQDPIYFQKHQTLEQEALEYFSLPPTPSRGGGEILTIPVVVHIIHNNGPENLSDAQVQQAIAWLNQAFANQGYYDQGSGADVGIQFCLAKRSPDGETTNGITRDISPLTELDIETEQLSMKNLNRWKPKEYVNIWLVKTICSTVTGCGVSAYAYYPSYHGGNLDGIVAEFGHFTSPAQVAILAHEMGHYFGLRHTFEGGCSNGNCLTDGDKVCDTPPDQSTAGIPCGQTANTCASDTQSGFPTDQPDMTTNFVDYGNLDCLHDFTDGQAGRMNFFLNGARKSLLASKGCLPPCPLSPTAAFSPGDTTILAGQTLFFNNASQNAVTFSWTINGTPFGGQQNAAYFFDTAGIFTVKLMAQPLNSQLCDADSAQVTVQVVCEVKADFSLSNLTPEEGQTVFISNNSQNANAFEWFVNGASQGATLDSIVFTESGSYEIRLVAKGDFCNSSATQAVFVRDSCTSKTFFFSSLAIGQSFIWEAQSTAVLADENLLIGGGSQSLNSSGYKALFVKMKPDGTMLWSKTVGRDSAIEAYCYSIVATPDGGFAALILQFFFDLNLPDNAFYLAKISANGTLQWAHTISENSALPSTVDDYEYYDLSITEDGGYLVGGQIKFDSNGNLVWSKVYDLFDYPKTAPYPDGGFIAINSYKSALSTLVRRVARYDAFGIILWGREFDFSPNVLLDVSVGADSNIYIVGRRATSIIGLCHTFLIKLAPDGEIVWSKEYLRKKTSRFEPRAFVTSDDGITVLAYVWFNASPLVTKFYRALLHTDYDGNIIWVRHYDDKFYSDPTRLSAIPEGGYLGVCQNTSTGETGCFKTDALGYAGECPSEEVELNVEDFTVNSSPILSIAQAGPTDFPLINLSVDDFPITFDTFCAPACPQGIELCNNNLDDDGDGLFDCLDPDCDCAEDVCHPKQANIWYFGNHAGLDFSTEPPTVLTDGQIENGPTASSICDGAGNLLFYADWRYAYNRFHEVMQNGNLLGPINSWGESLIVPHPGSNNLFYLLTLDYVGSSLRYSKVDMQLDSGRGGIVPGEKLISLTPGQDETNIAAVRSCSFDGYWVITKFILTGNFNVFRIDQNGLNTTPVTSSGAESVGNIPIGQKKVSPDGRIIARATDSGPVEIHNFNANTGEVGSLFKLWLQVGWQPIGIEFSPNGRYLYVAGTTRLYQLDLYAGDVAAIQNSAILLATKSSPLSFRKMQLAPNGKIYIGNVGGNNPFLDVIHNPNAAGAACQYQENGQPLPPSAQQTPGLCNFVSSYFAEPAPVKFSKEFSPDTICDLNQTYFYKLELGCLDHDSIIWKMEGLSGTLSVALFNAFATFDAPGSGRIIVTAYTECGVVADTLQIVVAEPFDKILDLGPDRVVCDNGVVTLDAGNGFTRYRWQNGSPDSLLTTLLPGKYWVDVWDACGNQQTDTVNVSVAPATVLELGLDQEGCPDLTAIFQRPDVFGHWLWMPADFLSCDTCPTVTAAPAATTEWIVVAQTGDGCISVDTLTFEIQDTLFFQLDTSVCFGQTLDLFGTTLPADTTALFFFPATGLGCDTLLTVNVLGLDAPFLEIEETICANEFFNFNGVELPADTTAIFLAPGAGGECDSVTIVKVSAWPPLTVSLPPDTTLRIGATLILNAETSGTGALTFAWSPAEGLSCTTCSDPEASPLATTLYALQVADANGCSAQDSMLVVVDTACNVIIPNAFSPNGDEVNDWFYPRADPCVRMVRLWRVVSRWGEIVFEKSNFAPNDPTLGWDGNRPNGEPFPSDVLVWYAELEYFDGKKEVKKGDVALLR